MSKSEETDKLRNTSFQGDGNQSNVQGNNTTNHIDNSDNAKGLEYMYRIVRQLQEEKSKLQEEKNRLVDELHSKSTSLVEAEVKTRLKAVEEELTKVKKEIRSVGRAKEDKLKGRNLGVARLVATSVVMVGSALVVMYLPKESVKKARSLPISVVDSVKNENPSKGKNKKSNYLDHVGIETGVSQEKKDKNNSYPTRIDTNDEEKKARTATNDSKNKGGFRLKESFADTMQRIEKERVEFGVNEVLEGLIGLRAGGYAHIVKPKNGQVFSNQDKLIFELKGEKREEYSLKILGNKQEDGSLLKSKLFINSKKSGFILKDFKKGLYYFMVYSEGDPPYIGKFLVK